MTFKSLFEARAASERAGKVEISLSDKMLWKDKRVDDLSREEAIEAVKYLLNLQWVMCSDENIRARAIGRVEMLRRG